MTVAPTTAASSIRLMRAVSGRFRGLSWPSGLALPAIVLVCSCTLNAQPSAADRDAKFEVASVKPSGPNARRGGLQILPGGRLSARNVPLRNIVTRAYGIKSFQLTGNSPVLDESYVIDAKAPQESPDDGQVFTMLQNLLAERFQLKIHRESKNMPVYVVVAANGGIKFHESSDTSAQPFISFRTGAIIAIRSKLDAFCNGISVLLDRPVFNETNLTGSYDFELHFDPNSMSNPGVPGQQYDAPSIFTAFHEQMGLKLEPKTRQVDVVIIDHVEKPSAN